MENEKEITLEEGFEKLNQIIKNMELPDVPLEDRFALYKEGVELVRMCSEKIDTVEKNLKVVNDDLSIREF